MILFGTEVLITQDMVLLDRALDARHKAKIPCKYGNISSSGGSRGLSGRMSLASGCYDFFR